MDGHLSGCQSRSNLPQMSEPKTIPTQIAVSEFIAGVKPERKREEAQVIDAIFRKVTGEQPKMWGPSIIGYGDYRTTYESGRDVHWLRTGFSPRKAKHSLYFMGGYCDAAAGKRREAMLAKMGKHSRGKSCVYVNKLADIDLTVLEEIIADDWAEMSRLYPS